MILLNVAEYLGLYTPFALCGRPFTKEGLESQYFPVLIGLLPYTLLEL